MNSTIKSVLQWLLSSISDVHKRGHDKEEAKDQAVESNSPTTNCNIFDLGDCPI